MAANSTSSGPSLAGLLKNNTVVGMDPSQDPQAMATLAAVQQYDPNARWVGGLGGDNNTPTYQLQFDPGKLPDISGTGSLGKGGAETVFAPSFQQAPTNSAALVDPSLTFNSPAYGNVTPNSNINQNYDTGGLMGLLGKVAPYAVMATLAYGGGLAASSLAGGAGATGAAGATGDAANAAAGSSDPFFYTGSPGAVDSWSAAAMGDPAAYGLSSGAAGTAGAAAPIFDQSTEAPLLTKVAAQLGIPVNGMTLSQLSNAAGLLGKALSTGNSISSLLGGGSLSGGSSGGGGGGFVNLGGNRQIADAGSLLRAFYAPSVQGSQQGSEALNPSNPMSLLPLRFMGLIS